MITSYIYIYIYKWICDLTHDVAHCCAKILISPGPTSPCGSNPAPARRELQRHVYLRAHDRRIVLAKISGSK